MASGKELLSMSHLHEHDKTTSRDQATTMENNDHDVFDIIEQAKDDQPKIFSKSEPEIPIEKQNGDLIENDDDLLIIDVRDVEQFVDRARLQSFDEMRNLNKDKKFDEWVYVETNRTTFQIHDNLLLVSSVYDDEKNCCVLQ